MENPISSEHTSSGKRHALYVALVYLVIRGIPDLLVYVLLALPDDTVRALSARFGAVFGYVLPTLPPRLLFAVPFVFQTTLSLLPVLLIEVLLVFLFSVGFLRRRPWAEDKAAGRLRWVVLIAATLIWSYVIRSCVLHYAAVPWMDAVQRMTPTPGGLRHTLAPLLRKAYWPSMMVLYASTLLWAWLPTWLHFRCARKPAGTPAAEARAPGADLSLQRAAAFASFLLGALILHVALIQTTLMGLWPWIVEKMDMRPSPDLIEPMGLPLVLGQLVFASLALALAAWFYARRLPSGDGDRFRMFGKPLLAGVATYLLTSLVMLAIVWLLAWLNPSSMRALASGHLENVQRLAMVLAIVLGIVSLVLLCLFSTQWRRSPRRWSVVIVVLLVCAAMPASVGWTIVRSNLGLAGSRPGLAVAGKLGDAHWRDMQQFCTGVVQTRHGTWLIGRDSRSSDDRPSYVPQDVPDLGKLVSPTESRAGLFGSDASLTTLARRQDDGTFKLVATIPDAACMAVSPQSDTLFLLTGMDFSNPAYPVRQSAVLRSTDHGATWHLLTSGFMAQADAVAWNLSPVSGTDQDVWAWGTAPEDAPASAQIGIAPPGNPPVDVAGAKPMQPTALFYSSDQGATAVSIDSPEPLVAPESYLKQQVRASDAEFSSIDDLSRNRFVAPVDDTHAYAWVSGFVWYHADGQDRRLMLTSRADLVRPNARQPWQVTRVVRQPGVTIEHLVTSADGRIYAIFQDSDGEWLARLDKTNGQWIDRHRTPSLLPGFLVRNRMWTRYFWSNGDYQVVSLWGDLDLPRLLFPFTDKAAEITTDAHFYTRDGGRSWHQLAIPGYLGVMGLSRHGSTLYWSQGDAYENGTPLQMQYDLSK